MKTKKEGEFELLHDYIDNGETIKAGTRFKIKSVWSSCIETTEGLISFKAWDFCVRRYDPNNKKLPFKNH